MKDVDAAYIVGIIDGEGTISLTRMHAKENRRPIVSIASTDIELLQHIRTLAGGTICSKKNYSPKLHKNSFTLTIKNKSEVFKLLENILPYLRTSIKRKRAEFILSNYDNVTIRNERYNEHTLQIKKKFEQKFFLLQ